MPCGTDNHCFWKDENPPECLNCGKTKQELKKELYDQEYQKAYDLGVKDGRIAGLEESLNYVVGTECLFERAFTVGFLMARKQTIDSINRAITAAKGDVKE